VVYRTAGGLAPYASYSTSFEVVTGTDNHGTPFKPLRGKQWEAGVKWMPERSRVSVTAAGYVLKEKNRLTTDPADPTNVLQRGEATIKGAELEVTTALPWLDLLGSYTYTNAKLTASSDPADPYLNKRLSSIPEHAASLWATHAVHAGRLHGLRFGAGVRYQGTTWDGQDLLATPSNTLVDAVLSFELGHWRYALNATNLFDKIYFGTCLDRGDCWYGSRRSVAVRAMYRY
jgi:iron complex outermembrane receptor protein